MTPFVKKLINPIVTGLAACICLAVTMVFLTIDFQILLVLGTLIFYLAGFINKNNGLSLYVNLLAILWSFTVLFSIFVLTEIPSLYFMPIFWVVAVFLGLWHPKVKNYRYIMGVVSVVILAYTVMYAIPRELQQSLSTEINQRVPDGELMRMDGSLVKTQELLGKTIVLDFFGTWCKPCIHELKELNDVANAFKDDPSVQFYVINADMGGDTPEKFQTFIAQNTYSYTYLYDHDGTFYKQLQGSDTGLPLLFVADKEGVLKWKHIGYNSAESDFAKNLMSLIREIQGMN